ncbi:MAG: monofunctional biosynthetic peptidoglycan transglycosylase [Saprospiraceae bacterium]|nr:monofunctional biosynthetic peptidoglycan transglycosylase [Saprospiraceae bacterium]
MKDVWRKIKQFAIRYYGDVIVGFVVLSTLMVLIYRIVPPPFTLLMASRTIVAEEGVLKYHWVNFKDISPYIKVCAMASEDQNLPFHFGLDFQAIDKAINKNKKKRKIFGASTITQQVAKNVFLYPRRSYIRKGLEVYFTLLIETLWTKERILEMYLNVAEMGELTFGVDAAAHKYFGKSAKKLSLAESSGIIAVLPNPRKYNVNSPGPYVSNRQSQIASLFYSLDGTNYLREIYVKSEKSLYDFRKYKK